MKENTIPIIYTLPNCKHCKELKDALIAEKVEFEERLFDSEIQTECIMENMFDDPPIIRINGVLMSSKKITELIEKIVEFFGVVDLDEYAQS